MLKKIIAHIRTDGFNGLLYAARNYIRNLVTPIYMTMLETFKTPEKKVVFCNFAGRGYSGYPRSICDELIKRKKDIKLIWLVMKPETMPKQVKAVNINSYSALWELATAKVWVDNCRKSSRIRKSKKQFYLQTWHAGGPGLKQSEGDAEDFLSSTYIEDAKHDSDMADLFISDCEWQNQKYRSAFWYQGEILNCTTPPNDLFYQNWNDIKNEVYKYFKIGKESRVILYAPTFRNNHSLDNYSLDCKRLKEICKNRFGGNWTVIVRLHPTLGVDATQLFGGEAIDGTSYPQIENIMIASEVFITDFSASMFLAFRWKIKTFLYASDYEEYIKNERPLYFNVYELPATFSKNNDELYSNIMSFSQIEYDNKCKLFSDKVGFFEGGQSVKTITDRIIKELG